MNVSKYYHSGTITNLGLHNVSVRFDKNEIVAITGDSGSGKSTLLNVITKIDGFDEGEIYYKGNETSYFSVQDMDDFRKNKIGFIFQNYNILDSYTVLENVMLPLTLKGVPRKEAKEKAIELIQKVGLSDRMKARGTKLSGGEKQRCVIARALASDCEILACDEPTGNLDSKTGAEIISLIKEVAKDKLVLIVTHNYDQVKDIVTRKIRVTDGEITEDVCMQPVEKDADEELEMEYAPLSKKVCLRVSKNNVVFTPRKTILLSLIFLAICMATLFLFQAISASMTDITHNSLYTNTLENRYVIYKKDHSEIKESALKGVSYDKNSFTEDFTVNVVFSGNDLGKQAVYYSDRYATTLGYGEYPKNDTEVLVCVEKGSWYASSYMYGQPLVGTTMEYNGKVYKVSGIGYIKDADGNVLLSHNTSLHDRMNSALMLDNISITVDGVTSTTLCYYKEGSKTILKLPQKYKDMEYSLSLFSNYAFPNLEVEYYSDESTNYFGPTIYYGEDSIVDVPIYEASVYASKLAVKTHFSSKVYYVDHCAEVTNDSQIENLLLNLYAYLLMVLSSLLLVVVFFITYMILSRVYASRKKDYEILRTLGVTKKDMKHIVNYEVLGICITVLVFAYILMTILLKTVPSLRALGKLQLITSLIYFVVTILFGFAIAKRFNRKLFRFSVTKSMKGDGKHD